MCILHRKHLQTYLEALKSNFQPSRHLKIFKNSGSGITFCLAYIFELCLMVTQADPWPRL
jgi:hypothetical protein